MLGVGRSADAPLLVGSVKSNIGHSEAAAGLLGTIKAALALHHGRVPRSLHFKTPHPDVPWSEGPLRIADEASDLPGPRAGWLAGVSATGLSGTNVHLVLGASPEQHAPAASAAPSAALTLALSANDPAALAELAESYAGRLRGCDPTEAEDACWTISARRNSQRYRAALVAADVEELGASLRAIASSPPAEPAPARRVVFVLSGHGSQWQGMTRGLRRSQPVFDEALQSCAAAIERVAGWSLLERLDDDERWLSGVPEVQPALWAIGVSLGEMWQSWGVRPDVTIGHSMGEVAAACLSGALSLDDGAAVICARSALMGRTAGHGAMGVVGLSRAAVEAELAAHGDVDVAGVNGPEATIVSGTPPAVAATLDAFTRQGAFARRIDIDIAAHSGQMQPLLDPLRAAIAGIAPREAVVEMISTVTAAPVRGEDLGPEYWTRNLREPVRLADAIETVLADGPVLMVELSPHPVLKSVIDELVARVSPASFVVATSRRDDEERATLDGAASMFEQGAELDWAQLLASRAVVDVPAYPWRRDLIAGPPEHLGVSRRAASSNTPTQDDSNLDPQTGPPVVTVAGVECLAGPAIVALMVDAAAGQHPLAACEVTDIQFLRPIGVLAGELLRFELLPGSTGVACVARLADDDEVAARATFPHAGRGLAETLDIDAIAKRSTSVGPGAVTGALEAIGIAASTPGARLTELAMGEREVLTRISTTSLAEQTPRVFGVPAAVMECAALACATLLPAGSGFVGRGIARIAVSREPGDGAVLAHVRPREPMLGCATFDIALARTDGVVFAVVEGLQMQHYDLPAGLSQSHPPHTAAAISAEEDHMSFPGLVRFYGPDERLLVELQLPSTTGGSVPAVAHHRAGPALTVPAVSVPAPAVPLVPLAVPAPVLGLAAEPGGDGADIATIVRAEIADLLQLDEKRVSPGRTLADLGFDSLMTAKLRRRITSRTGTALQSADVSATMTVEALVDRAAA